MPALTGQTVKPVELQVGQIPFVLEAFARRQCAGAGAVQNVTKIEALYRRRRAPHLTSPLPSPERSLARRDPPSLRAETFAAQIASVIRNANEIAGSGKPVIVNVRIDYSKKTAFTLGAVKTNFARFPLNEKLRFLSRAAMRHVLG
jgi:hypothetical protein